MKLVEHIRHGDYENINSIELIGGIQEIDLADLLMRSPYHSKCTSRAFSHIFSDLITTGKSQYGWADYYLETG